MTREEFEKLVAEGIGAIPKQFIERLNNVVIVVEDEPSREQRKKMRLRKWQTLFGLYEGIPLTSRGQNYAGALPDKITIFQKPIEEASKNPEGIKGTVRDTVWHEIAHHFGMDHDRINMAERRRRRKKQ